jgi:hypothetical protein
MSKDAEKVGSAAHNSCPLCGSDKFTWGVAQGPHNLMFKSDDASWIVRNTAFGGQQIKARQCDSCGNIQFFALEGVASEK